MAQYLSGETSGDSLLTAAQLAAETRLEEERMQEVLYLLKGMFEREEITARMIINCLYDVGTVKIINRKFRCRPANQFMHWIARFSKPVAGALAIRRLKKTAPELIANWLRGKVEFEAERRTQTVTVTQETVQAAAQLATQPAIAPAPMPSALEAVNQAALEASNQEVLRLRSQVKTLKTLATLLIGATVTLSGTVAWSVWKSQTNSLQPITQLVGKTSEHTQPTSTYGR